MIDFLLAGVALGFAAGISPGPLLVMVITETIKFNRKEGIKVAIIPLFSDLPIVLFSVFVVYKLSNSDLVLAIISFLGTIFLSYLAWDNIKTKSIEVSLNNNLTAGKANNRTIQKGIVANILSPHPYLFWMLVGAPMTIKAFNHNLTAAILFVVGFYMFIVGTKIGIALITDKSKNILSSSTYLIIVRLLGFVLLVFAIILLRDGFGFLKLF